jgi:FkbM family methyltransferase
LDLSDVIGHSLYFFKMYFAPTQFLTLLKPHWVVIDVGAHVGTVALQVAAIVKTGKVYAYEPFQETFEELEHNIQLNPFNNIVAIKKAVGKTTHRAQLFKVNQFNSGMNRIKAPETISGNFEWVDVTTLDDEFEKLKLDHVDMIKIDAEGFELNVLHGAKEILERFHPILLVELIDGNLRAHGQSALEVIQFIRKLGYQCVDAKTSMPLVTWSKIDTDILCYV